jgi:glycosyltransferase involved in cell wall biosynthesis
MICLDARMIQSSGIGTYLQGFLSAAQKRTSASFSLALFGNPTMLPEGPWSSCTFTAPIYSINEQWAAPRAFKEIGGTLWHSPHYNMPFWIASQTVVTVHDLIHLKFPQYWPSPKARAYAYVFFYHIVPKARAILTVSENTKRDLIEMLSIPSNRITVAPLAASRETFQTLTPDAMKKFAQLKLPSDYLLYIGNLKEFKNVERLVDAYANCSKKDDFPELVLAGRNFIPGFERKIAATPGVRWIGEISRDVLPCLYRNALAFLFPSLYEGFGLPPLEAMMSGTAVLCSNRASLPEVVGDAALIVNPENTEEITAGMERLVQDTEFRRQLSIKGLVRAAQFSWEKTADQTLRVYEQCLK